MKCPKCAAENPAGSPYCRKCGQSLSNELVCPKCKHINLADSDFCNRCGQPLGTAQVLQAPAAASPSSAVPMSFADGRCQVKKFLGEGGRKNVYLAHDTVLDRDAAFALIKTEKLDETARTRIKREAQAMGGQVTAKADQYSLGAMLYEMVTGRPPLLGDDSVAIIGRHINTPPVSPSWHRADLPPALETLIMQRLEKDPEKRPASAAVVVKALGSISTGKSKPEPSKEKAAPAENPLYRRVFVGREPELRRKGVPKTESRFFSTPKLSSDTSKGGGPKWPESRKA
jgi:serine/threonine protein kinase/ribosomal protein L40E